MTTQNTGSTQPTEPTPADVFRQGFVAHLSGADGAPDADAVTDLYRAIAPAARGRAIATAMADAARSGADGDAVGDLYDRVTATPARSSAPQVDPSELVAIRLASLVLAQDAIMADLPDGATPDAIRDRANEIGGGVPDADLSQRVLAAAGRAVAAVTRGTGTRGTPTQRGTGRDRGRRHVDAYVAAHPADDGTFVTPGAIARWTGDGSPYAGGSNPSPGAIANVLTGPQNDRQNTGAGWVGQNDPRGLVYSATATAPQGDGDGQ